MTDEQTPDQSQPDSEGSDSIDEFGSDEELDQLLAEAASLASDLSQEVGDASEEGGSESPPPDSDQTDDVSAMLDAELAALEALVSDTSDELGDANDDSTDTSATASEPEAEPVSAPQEIQALDIPVEGDAADNIPVFDDVQPDDAQPVDVIDTPSSMDDKVQEVEEIPAVITQPQQDPPSEDQPTPQMVVQSRKPGVVGSGLMGAVKGKGKSKKDEDDTDIEEEPPIPKWLQLLNEKVSPVALVVCSRGAKILDKLDSRIGDKVNDQIKTLVGWAAIATLGTSIIIYILSLFYIP